MENEYMLLKDNKIEMKWHATNKQRYVDRGYVFTKMGDTFFPLVEDVVQCSKGAVIPVQCDYCGEIYYPTVNNYLKVHNRGEQDCCVKCKGIKIKETVQKEYGVDNVALVPCFREKQKQTCRELYGIDYPLQSQYFQQKCRDTIYNKYGVSSCFKIPFVCEKRNATMQKLYGCIFPYQNKEILAKVHASYYQNGTCPTSKKQIELFDVLKIMFGDCQMNYPCDSLSRDCVVVLNGVKIDIEYDGWYWHKNRQEEDRKRDHFVIKQGYKVIRFLAYANRIPTNKEIENSIKRLTTTNKDRIIIELK